MTAFTDWAVGLCAAGVACALLRMLCPEGAMNSAMRVITAMLFFCCLLSPIGMLRELFADGFLRVDASAPPPSSALSERVDEQATAIIEHVLLEDATARLGEITVKRVEILCASTDAQSSMVIERIKVVFDKEEHPLGSSAIAVLEQAWGVPVEVYYSDAD